MPKTDITVQLIGRSGNAFAVLANVRKALIAGGHPELVQEYLDEAMSGNYEHLLTVTAEYVHIE